MLGALFVLIAAYFWLDRYYWILCPLMMSLSMRVPGLPFNGNECGVIILFAIYFVRNALHREMPVKWDRRLFVVLPAFVWMMFFMVVNPTGINLLGSESIGGRFYFTVVLGFLGLIALSTHRFTEKDCKVLFSVVAGAAILSTLRNSLWSSMFGGEDVYIGEDDAAASGSHYELLGAVSLYALIFARYSVSEVLQSFKRLCAVLLFVVLAIYSGKRAAFGKIAFIPVFRTILAKRDFVALLCCGATAAFMLGFMVAGDGVFFKLPQSVRRAMSIVVPKYETGSARGLNDDFRAEMRREARLVIRQSPMFGRKGFKMDREATIWTHARQTRYGGHVIAGAWHSAWYGYAADFGIPCLVFFLLFQLYYIRFIFKSAAWCTTLGPFRSACFIYYSSALLLLFVFSYTSGHSAFTSFETWIDYGFLLAIVRGGVDEWYQRFSCVRPANTAPAASMT